jgi:hypothetical protein
MRSLATGLLWLAPLVMFAAGSATAQQEKVLVLAKHIDQVENPRELEKLWKEVVNTPIVKAISDAVVTFYTGCAGCTTVAIDFINANVVHFRDTGEEHLGAIKAPDGIPVQLAQVH